LGGGPFDVRFGLNLWKLYSLLPGNFEYYMNIILVSCYFKFFCRYWTRWTMYLYNA